MINFYSYHGVALDPPALSVEEARTRARAKDPVLSAAFERYEAEVSRRCWEEMKQSSFLLRWLEK